MRITLFYLSLFLLRLGIGCGTEESENQGLAFPQKVD